MVKRYPLLVFLLGLSVVLAPSIYADFTLFDSGTGGTDETNLGYDQTNWWNYSSSFTATSSYNLVNVTLWIGKVTAGSGNLYLEFLTCSALGTPSTTSLGSSSTVIVVSSLSTTSSPYNFSFNTPISITSGTRYCLNLWTTGNSVDNHARVEFNNGGKAGETFGKRSGGVWIQWKNNSQFRFQTYGTATTGATAQDNINISETYPINQTYFNQTIINFNATVNSTYNFNISFYMNGTLNQTNTYTSGTNKFINFTTILQEGNYNYYFKGFQSNDSFYNETTNTTYLFIDLTNPTITNNLQPYYTNYLNLNISTYDLNPKNFSIKSSCNIDFTNSSVTTLNYSYNINISIINCSLGYHYINITVYDKSNRATSQQLNYSSMASLNVSAYSALNNASINNFSVYINGSLLGNTTTGLYQITNLTQSDYNITIDSPTYALTTVKTSIVNSTNKLNVSLYGTNSVSIFILDEVLLSPVYSNISIKWTSSSEVWINVTNTSYLYIENITAGYYTLQFYSSSYATRTYGITVGNRSTQSLTAYMISNTYSTIFSITDIDTGVVLENVSFSVYQQNGSNWIPVQSGYSDILGKVQFYYNPLGSYRFNALKNNYNDLIFFLNPILFSTYDIRMTKNQSINYTVDYDRISVIYSPSLFYDGAINSFSFVISSPDGLFTGYGINLTYPGGSNATTGVNAIGEQLNLKITLSGSNSFDRVRLDYYYITTLSGRRNFTYYLPIANLASSSNATMIKNRNVTYGLGLFERILLATIIILFVAGICSLVGQPIPGLSLGLIIMAYMVYIGFIPLWLILPSIFIGILFLIWKSGGY